MPNKVERVYYNSQASPVANANVEAGSSVLNHDANPTAAIAFDASMATIQSEAEGLASIGAGNIAVAATANGYTLTYQGALASTNVVEDFSASSVTLKQKADTISVVVDQAGIADVPCVPSISTTTSAVTPVFTYPTNNVTTSAVTPVNEVQQVDLGGATLGTFTLNGNSTTGLVVTLNTAGIQSACNTIWGNGETVVASLGGDLFSVTFSGSAVDNTNHPQMTITLDLTNGTPVVTTTTQGATGVSQVDTVTFSPGTPVAGTWTFDQEVSISYATNVSNGTGFTASGSAASGSVQTVWDGFGSHTPVSVLEGTLRSVIGVSQIDSIVFDSTAVAGFFNVFALNSYNINWNQSAAEQNPFIGSGGNGVFSATTPASGLITMTWDGFNSHGLATVTTQTLLSVVGQPGIISVSFSDVPTEGNAFLSDGFNATMNFNHNDSATAVLTAIQNGGTYNLVTVSGAGTIADPYVITDQFNTINLNSWTGAEGINPLRKALALELVTTTEGGPDTPPDPPTNFTATAVSSSRINLAWTGVTCDNYELERSPNGTDTWALIASPGSADVSYGNTGLTASTAYFYRLRAVNTAGNSSWVTADATTEAAGASVSSPFWSLIPTVIGGDQ